MTPKQKIAHLEAELNKCRLTLFDVYNTRFSKPVVLNLEAYGTEFKGERLEMSASWRAMPLFLVVWKGTKDSANNRVWPTPYYMTEDELDNLSKIAETPTQRSMRDAYDKLKHLHRQQLIAS